MQNITYYIIISSSAICYRILEFQFHGKNGFFLSSLVKLKLSKLSNIPLGATQYCTQNKIFCWVKFKTPKTFALCCHPSSVHPSVFTLFQLFFFFFSCKSHLTQWDKISIKCNFASIFFEIFSIGVILSWRSSKERNFFLKTLILNFEVIVLVSTHIIYYNIFAFFWILCLMLLTCCQHLRLHTIFLRQNI